MTFDEQVLQSVQEAVLKLLRSGSWLTVDYHNQIKLPPDLIRSVYASIDMDRVKVLVKEQCEERLADAVYNSLATEVATDAKKILSNTELREDCRAYLRTKMREAALAMSEVPK